MSEMNEVENGIEYYPLTHPQKGIWYTEKMYPGTSIGNVAGTLRIKGDIDYDLLEKAINIFIEKNDGMRLRVNDEDVQPVQYISDYNWKELDFIDFSQTGDIDGLYKWNDEQTRIPFKLIDSDLFYFALVKVNDQDGGMFIKTHHLISDAWTMNLIVNEVIEYYSALKDCRQISNDRKPSYIDYVLSENEYLESNRFQKDREYWINKFESTPEVTTLKKRTSSYISTKARRKTLLTPVKFTKKLREYSVQNKISVYALFMSALCMYINRTMSKEDLTLGTTILNRTNAAEKNTAGMFISTVPVRIGIHDKMDFATFSQMISRELASVLRRQKYPYDLLLKEFREKHNILDNLYDIALSYQNAKLNKDEHSEEYKGRWHFNGHQTNSLSIHINDREGEGHLIVDYDFLSDLFYVKEIEFIHEHIISLLWHAIDNPSKEISKIEMISEKEKHKILYEFNNTATDYPKDKTIHQLFEEQVKKTPNNIAVVFEGKELTFKELNEKSNQLARILKGKGIKSNAIVGIMVHRSLEMIIGIMAILKAGGAYLPIDPEYPQDRIKYMLEDSQTSVLLIQNNLKEKVSSDVEIIEIDNENLYSGENSNLQSVNSPNNLIYVIYTSGSTGRPKGVMIEHYSVVNRINWMQKEYPLTESDVILQKTPYTFDVSVWELFWWALVGAKLCFLIPNGEKDPKAVVSAIEENRITTMHFVPSMLNLFLEYVEEAGVTNKLSSLERVFASGEALNLTQGERFNRLLYKSISTRLINLYGPTEATVDVSYFDCSNDSNLKAIPIGKPIDNISLYILDKNNNLQPIGVPGELCIAGDGLARGYINKPELTKEKFVPNPFVPGERIYKTGDLARWFSGGNIEYLGRIDHQVKIRGVRIELGEVETWLTKYEGIKEAVVIDREDKEGKRYLCAYLVSEYEISVVNLRGYLSKVLPDYMIPSYFIRLNKMPLSPNGKIDRKALPEPKGQIHTDIEYVEPSSYIEKTLCDIWAELLEVEKVGVNDNFFDLGGDSLTIVNILTHVLKYNWNLKAQDFYEYPSVRQLAYKIKASNFNNHFEGKYDETTIITSNILGNCYNSIRSSDENLEHVLLTGASGFLGMHILNELLVNTNAKVYCLIRGREVEETKARFENLIKFYFENDLNDYMKDRVLIINGDVTMERLGLSQSLYANLGEKIDTIIHSAALVKHYGAYSEFEKVNVFGTKNVIEFAKQFNVRANFISTLTVSGNYLVSQMDKTRKFTEEDFYIGQSILDNVYVRSKFEAEKLIYESITEGLDAYIFRVGNLTGRYKDGKFQININENAFYNRLKSFIELGALPKNLINQEVEFTPVDSCSDAILKLVLNPLKGSRVFHLNNQKTIKIEKLVDMLNTLEVEIKFVEESDYEKIISGAQNDRSKTKVLVGIVNDFTSEKQLSYESSIYINSNQTLYQLKELGFEWPTITLEYFKSVIEYMNKVSFISF